MIEKRLGVYGDGGSPRGILASICRLLLLGKCNPRDDSSAAAVAACHGQISEQNSGPFHFSNTRCRAEGMPR